MRPPSSLPLPPWDAGSVPSRASDTSGNACQSLTREDGAQLGGVLGRILVKCRFKIAPLGGGRVCGQLPCQLEVPLTVRLRDGRNQRGGEDKQEPGEKNNASRLAAQHDAGHREQPPGQHEAPAGPCAAREPHQT